MKLQNATALVTGANRGIGQAFVQALLNAGVQKVYAAARDRNSLEAVVSLDPARVIPVQVNVTQVDEVRHLVEQTPDVNLLINNAGVLSFGNILDISAEALHQQFDVNFYGTLNMARAFVPVLERNGAGAIVNMLTLVALASMPGLSAYNASKAAAWSMTQSLRASVADKNIAVYGVFPGAVDTDMLAGVDMAKTSPADVVAAVLQGIESEQEDIFPDPMSSQLYAAWKQDHKAIEKQFAAM
jgi:NAD(P)-dependent dehydrogenase (short-subunit alcohol dehydrogenase family)